MEVQRTRPAAPVGTAGLAPVSGAELSRYLPITTFCSLGGVPVPGASRRTQ